jgi:DNA polymerase-3 subunit delta'
MSFARIRGHERPLHLVRAALRAGRLPHALLFSGPDGVGKRTAALELAKAVNCAGPPGAAGAQAPDDACDACPSCRLADRGGHPDILVVAPEGRSLKIDQVREVERHASLSPYASRRRVALVDGAEVMTPQAQNAFLKTLEEPPGGAVLLLISAAPTALLPTIRSRCQEVRFGPLPDGVVVDLLAAAGWDPEDAARAAALAGGSVGQAGLWAERFPRARQEELLQRTWASLASPGRALAWAKQLADEYRERPKRDLVPWVLLLLGAWARHLANPAAGDEGPGGFGAGRGQVSRRAALEVYGAVAGAQEALDRNANLQLALDAMLLRMRAALAIRESS